MTFTSSSRFLYKLTNMAYRAPHCSRTISMSGRDRIAVENYDSKYFEKEIGFNFNPTEKRSKYYLTTYIFIGPVGKVGKILI